MKVIFLDIDGVLNGIEFQKSFDKEPPIIDETRLTILKEIIDRSGANVVLSSSWKKFWEPNCTFDIVFKKSGIDIYDITPALGRKRDEISAWLSAHPNTESYVILVDAQVGWGDLLPFLVITDPLNSRGLEYEHIEKALNILNN